MANTTGEPVPGFPLKFTWLTGDWARVFDALCDQVKSDVARARAEGRLVFYLSCPVSSRGGGYSGTNVDIARMLNARSWNAGARPSSCSTPRSTSWNPRPAPA